MKFKLLDSDNIEANKHLERIEKEWKKKEILILREIEGKTGIKINTQKITCFINTKDTNGYYGEDHITLGIVDENTETDISVIAHELFHIAYWQKLRELDLFSKEIGQEEKWEWELAEVTVYLLQKELQFLWPNTSILLYSLVEETHKRIKEIWENNSFSDYLIKSYKLLK